MNSSPLFLIFKFSCHSNMDGELYIKSKYFIVVFMHSPETSIRTIHLQIQSTILAKGCNLSSNGDQITPLPPEAMC